MQVSCKKCCFFVSLFFQIHQVTRHYIAIRMMDVKGRMLVVQQTLRFAWVNLSLGKKADTFHALLMLQIAY